MRRPTHRSRTEWLALTALLLVVAAALVFSLYREYLGVTTREGERLQGQARVVDENIALQLDGANKALLGMRKEILRLDLVADEPTISSKLTLLTDAMPGISSMLVLDADGTVVASSRGDLMGKNFRQREYFKAPRQGHDPQVLYVSPPFHSSVGTYIIVVSRVLTGPAGEFLGVITATLDPAYFSIVLRSVLYAPDMRSTLIHRDGQAFLSVPEQAAGVPAPHPDLQPFLARHLRDGRTATLVDEPAPPGAIDRMAVLRNVDRADLHLDKPMVVLVSRSREAIFLPWRGRAWEFGVVFGIVLTGSCLALSLNQRRREEYARIEEAVAQERRAASDRLELALRGADLGLWDLRVTDDHFVVNLRERTLLGYAAADELPQGRAWRDLIHPEDRATVDASILPHLRGEAENYGCELRLRHRDGHYVWVSSCAMIVERNSRGAPLRIVGTHLDISERKRSEERLARVAAQLRDSEEELRQVTDNMPALVSRLDSDQRFRFVNQAYGDWLGIDPATLLGRTLAEVYGAQTHRNFLPHIEAALAGQRVVYEHDMATVHGMRRVEVTVAPQRGDDDRAKGLYALIIDITARHQAELRQVRSEERLSLALEGSSLALFDWDLASGMLYHSAEAAAMRGDPPAEATWRATDFRSFVHPEDLPGLLERLRAALIGTTPLYHAEFRLRKISGDWLWVRARGRVVQRDPAGRALRLAGTYGDINERKLAEGRLRRLAEFDTLTGLPNRALFNDRLRQAMLRAARGKPMALLFLDIDHFKTINDTLGHEAGDQLLKIFAGRMQGAVRESDTVARLAGDEFTIILEGLRDVGDAEMLAGKLVAALGAPVTLEGVLTEVSASVGLAMCRPGETDDVALLRRADAALYAAKRRGRNQYHCSEFGSEGPMPMGAEPDSALQH